MKQPLNILFVGNSSETAMTIEDELKKGGYNINMRHLDDHSTLHEEVVSNAPDVVVADRISKKIDGIDAVKMIHRYDPDLPCIIVANTDQQDDLIEAIKAGACDCIHKEELSRVLPVVTRELQEIRLRNIKKKTVSDVGSIDEHYRGLVEFSLDSMVLTDEQGRIISFNKASEEIMGVRQEEAIGKNLWDVQYAIVLPKYKTTEFYSSLKNSVLGWCNNGIGKDEPTLFETEFINKSGNIIVLQSRIFTVKTSRGYRLGSISRDITELQKSRAKEKQLLEHLRVISGTAMDFVKLKTTENINLYISNKIREITQSAVVVVTSYNPLTKTLHIDHISGGEKNAVKKLLTSAQGNLHNIAYKLSPAAFEKLITGHLQLLEKGTSDLVQRSMNSQIQEVIRNRKSEKAFFIGLTDSNLLYGSVLIIAPGIEPDTMVLETFCNQASIALHSKSIMNVLQQHETRFSTLIEKNNDIIFTINSKQQITSINPIGKKLITGKCGEQVNIKNFMTAESYSRMRKTIRQCAMKEDSICSEEIELFTLSGNLLTFHVNLLITYTDHKPAEVFGIARNITRNKMLQNEVLSKIIETEEREKKAFAEELHDGLGSLLSTINIYAGMLMKKGKSGKQKQEYLGQLMKLVNEAVSNVRLFSNSLTPNVLNDFGLIAAVKIFCDRINNVYPGLVRYSENFSVSRFDRIIEVNLYRIIIEMINNTIKFSKPEEIKVELLEKEKNIVLKYKSGGKDFNINDMIQSNTSGVWLKNIAARVNSLNGILDRSEKGSKDLCFKVTIPKLNTN